MKIDEEFKGLIPPLSGEELVQLEENIKDNGCRDPLVVWRGILIDGHNRYDICARNGIEYKTVEVELPDREAAKLWIYKNQLGRRNITPDWFRYCIGKLYEDTKKNIPNPEGVGGKSGKVVKDQNDPQQTTADRIAADHGVSSSTVKRAAKFAREVDENPEYKEALFQRTPVSRVKKQKQIKQAKEKIVEQTKTEIENDPPKAYFETAKEFLSRFEPRSVNLLLTDPPYSTDLDDVHAFAAAWLPPYLNLVSRDGSAYVFIGAYPDELQAYLGVPSPDHVELKQVLVWTYRNTLGQNPKDRYKLNWQAILFYRGVDSVALDCPATQEQWAVQDISAPDGRQGDRYHKWQKPLEICERFIRHTTKPGDTVIDPFVCTGTTILAASKVGRNGIGCDNSKDNLGIAKERGCTIIGL